MKADLYIRVSTDEQAEKGYSQRDQEERLRKHCAFKNIAVRRVIYEDYSAKTFNRPAWKELLDNLRSKKGQVNLILFTKWDRFSRNAADAFQMINTLRKLGVEPQAIEQQLDLDVPENKIMLGIYLTAPEVENDRRSLNVKNGMRRAVKEGRWMNGAPLGYINRSTEDGKKYIAIEQPYAGIMKWAFETLASEQWHVEHVYREARQKGLRCCKNQFWNLIRNPVYCGKIFLKAYKDEPACILRGNHEPIISESLYLQVQDVLNGKKRHIKTALRTRDEFMLQGFLLCPKCGIKLYASASKGRTMYYSYYHCQASCGTRFKSEVVNQLFVDELNRFVPKNGMEEVYTQVVTTMFKKNASKNNSEIQKITDKISSIQDFVTKSRMKFMTDQIDRVDYYSFKKDCEAEMERLEARLMEFSRNKTNVGDLVGRAVKNLYRVGDLFEVGGILEKRKLIGSIFPEKLVFDGTRFRPVRINVAVSMIFEIENLQKGDISEWGGDMTAETMQSFLADVKLLGEMG